MTSQNLERLKILTQELNAKELELSETKDLLESFFDMSIDLLSVSTSNGVFLKINPAWEKTLGWTLKELQSKPFIEFVHPKDRLKTMEEFRKILEANHTYYFRNRYLCKDGTYRVLCWTARLSEDKKHVFGIARDFTKMMEKCDD
jgi:PAS domain S-box-containing protein